MRPFNTCSIIIHIIICNFQRERVHFLRTHFSSECALHFSEQMVKKQKMNVEWIEENSDWEKITINKKKRIILTSAKPLSKAKRIDKQVLWIRADTCSAEGVDTVSHRKHWRIFFDLIQSNMQFAHESYINTSPVSN